MENKRTIAETIRELQVQTGAPTSFVHRIESELLSRGVLLDGDAKPYVATLRDAFLRDLCQRENPHFVRDNARELQASYFRLKREQEELAERMEEIAIALRRAMRFERDTLAYDTVPGPDMEQ